MIGNDIGIFQRDHLSNYLVIGRFIPFLLHISGQYLSHFFQVQGGGDVHLTAQVHVSGNHFTMSVILQVVFYPGQIENICYQFRIYRLVDRWSAIGHPHESLQTVTGIHDVGIHLGIPIPTYHVLTVRILDHVHEDQSCKFQTTGYHLQRRARISSPEPGVLTVGYGFHRNSKVFREQFAAIADGVLFPVYLFAWIVEYVMGHHLELGEMSSAAAHIIEIIQSDTGLGYCQRICRWFDQTRCYVGLKICDGSDGQIDVVPPPCNNRIRFHFRMAVTHKKV